MCSNCAQNNRIFGFRSMRYVTFLQLGKKEKSKRSCSAGCASWSRPCLHRMTSLKLDAPLTPIIPDTLSFFTSASVSPCLSCFTTGCGCYLQLEWSRGYPTAGWIKESQMYMFWLTHEKKVKLQPFQAFTLLTHFCSQSKNKTKNDFFWQCLFPFVNHTESFSFQSQSWEFT